MSITTATNPVDAAAPPHPPQSFPPGSLSARLAEVEAAFAAGLLPREQAEELRARIVAAFLEAASPQPPQLAPTAAVTNTAMPASLDLVLGALHSTLSDQRDDKVFPWKERARRCRAEREVFSRVSLEALRTRFVDGVKESLFGPEDAVTLAYLLYATDAERMFFASTLIEHSAPAARLEAHNMRILDQKGEEFGARHGSTVINMPYPLFPAAEVFNTLNEKVLRQAQAEATATTATYGYDEAYYSYEDAVVGGASAVKTFGTARPAIFRPARAATATQVLLAPSRKGPGPDPAIFGGAGRTKWFQEAPPEQTGYWAKMVIGDGQEQWQGLVDLTALTRAHDIVMHKLSRMKVGGRRVKGGEADEDYDPDPFHDHTMTPPAPIPRTQPPPYAPSPSQPPKAALPAGATQVSPPAAPQGGKKGKRFW